MKLNITNIIKELRSEYITKYGYKDFAQINTGGCENFAIEIIQKLGGYSDILTEICSEAFNYDLPGHVWIVCNKLHYDSECEQGVENYMDLPIFKRYTNEQNAIKAIFYLKPAIQHTKTFAQVELKN